MNLKQLIACAMFGGVSFCAFGQASQDETYYNEAYDSGSGTVGEVHAVRQAGVVDSFVYDIDQDGAFNVYEGDTGQLQSHGRVHANGVVESKPPSQPKPPRRPGIGGSKPVLLCALGEQIAWARCETICRNTGIQSYQAGMCGFATTCTCHVPPPPPTPPSPVPSAGYAPPWQTINNFWGGSCGIFQVCDSLDPF